MTDTPNFEELQDKGLSEAELAHHPIEQFQKWYLYAQKWIPEENAVSLATSPPRVRTVLLKGFDERGFRFFTNYNSQKAQELQAQPNAALLFYWKDMKRQVSIEGSVQQLSEEENRLYFESRPRGSQIGAWASNQSQVIGSRESLEKEYQRLKQEFEGQNVPCPPFWGGFCLTPTRFEFWQGRAHRLHDRFQYRLNASSQWIIERLAP